MASLKKIRTSLGLTQEQAAEMLSLSNSNYAMIERGNRKLPQQTREFLKQIEASSATAVRKIPETTDGPDEKSFYHDHAMQCLSDARKLNSRLHKMEEQFNRFSLLLVTAREMKTSVDEEITEAWFIYIERYAVLKLKSCSQFQQDKLRTAVHLLNLEAGMMMERAA